MTGSSTRRDAEALLRTVAEATAMIADEIAGIDLRGFLADARTRTSVEREFFKIGEALSRLEGTAPELAGRLPDAARIAGTCAQLANARRETGSSMTWDAAVHHVPWLRRSAQALLAEMKAAASDDDMPSPFEPPSPFG